MTVRSLRILLVEDDLFLAKSTAKLLERLGGHQVLVTDEPQVIFELSQAREIDAIVMDVNLPEAFWEGKKVSGIDLSKLLKTNVDTTNIPIIILTAYAMADEHEILMVNSQADDFFAKPIRDYAVLIEAIERLAN